MGRRKLRPHGAFFLVFCALGAPAMLVAGCASEAQAARPRGQLWRDADKKPVVADKNYDPRSSLAPMVEAVQPGVIEIAVTHEGFLGFGGAGTGSGFIISPDGHAVTNAHVVEGREKIEVVLADKRRFAAVVVGADPQTDIALIKLQNASGLPTVVLGKSDDVRVGDWVVAIGTPMGLEQSVSRGIVSAKGRGSMGLYPDGYVDFLQTDAAINPGSSGGPLFNLRGEVVGMNTAVGRGVGGGLGFAVPVDQIRRVIPDLADDGVVARGWLGVTGRDVEPALGKRPTPGAVLSEVHPDSPAGEAGLEIGDRVTKVAGKTVDDFDDLRGRIGEFKPKDKVELELQRDGKTKTIVVRLGARPKPDQLARIGNGGPGPTPAPNGLWDGKPPRLGVEVEEVEGSVVVRRVQAGSVAEELGLQAGDVVREINGKRIQSTKDIAGALERNKTRVKVDVKRGETTHSATLERN